MDDPRVLFGERHKQTLLDLVCEAGYPWAFALDSDEVFERNGPEHMRQLLVPVQVVPNPYL